MRDDVPLTRDVARRVQPVVALLDAHTWPYAELGTLIGFLRTSPPDARPLHEVAARLEDAYERPCPMPELRRIVDELVAALPAGELSGVGH
jgi:hypothetical protein